MVRELWHEIWQIVFYSLQVPGAGDNFWVQAEHKITYYSLWLLDATLIELVTMIYESKISN